MNTEAIAEILEIPEAKVASSAREMSSAISLTRGLVSAEELVVAREISVGSLRTNMSSADIDAFLGWNLRLERMLTLDKRLIERADLRQELLWHFRRMPHRLKDLVKRKIAEVRALEDKQQEQKKNPDP